MRHYFAKSLDRPVEMFSLKGGWILVFLSCAGISLSMGFVVGFLTSAGWGISTVLVLIIVSFFGCSVVQSTIPSRELKKLRASRNNPRYIIRNETLYSILRSSKTGESEKNINK